MNFWLLPLMRLQDCYNFHNHSPPRNKTSRNDEVQARRDDDDDDDVCIGSRVVLATEGPADADSRLHT